MNTHTKQQKKFAPKNSKGFTLVELLVSLGIFVAVMTVSISSLVIVNNAAVRAQQMRVLLDNVNFSIDAMVRTVRTAEAVGCGQVIGVDCPMSRGLTSSTLSVKSTLGQREDVTFRLYQDQEKKVIQKRIGDSSARWLDVTSEDIEITTLNFYVEGATLSDQVQPLVRIFVAGVAKTKDGTTEPFTFHTAVTPRASGL